MLNRSGQPPLLHSRAHHAHPHLRLKNQPQTPRNSFIFVISASPPISNPIFPRRRGGFRSGLRRHFCSLMLNNYIML